MAEEAQASSPPSREHGRPEIHPAALNPEQHLLEAHKLSIQVQGKEGPTGQAVWALVREDRGKVKTLKVHRGTRREAISRFYSYVHPAGAAAPPPPRRAGGPRPAPRPGGGGGRRPGPGAPRSGPGQGPRPSGGRVGGRGGS